MRIIHILSFLVFTQVLWSQSHDTHAQHHTDDHAHPRNEIGVAISSGYCVGEKEFAPGLHLHYIRELEESKFGLGLGYERIFNEHKHNTIGIAGSYRPIHPLAIILSPGIAFEGGDHSDIHFAMHVEVAYEFEVGKLHIGPIFDFAYDPEDYHLSLGLHIGYGF